MWSVTSLCALQQPHLILHPLALGLKAKHAVSGTAPQRQTCIWDNVFDMLISLCFGCEFLQSFGRHPKMKLTNCCSTQQHQCSQDHVLYAAKWYLHNFIVWVSHSKQLGTTCVWNYNASSLKKASPASHINLAMDGFRVEIEDAVVVFNFLLDLKLASVPPC